MNLFDSLFLSISSYQVDIEKPLLSNDFGEAPGQISCSARRCLSEEYRHDNDVNIGSLVTHLSPKDTEKQLIGRHGPGVLKTG